MDAIKYAIFFAADIVLIGFPATLVYLGLWEPVQVAFIFSAGTHPYSSNVPVRHYVLLLICAVGFGTILYSGIGFLFSWAPHSWGTITDEGDFETFGDGLGLLFAFVGSIGLTVGLISQAGKFDDLELTVDVFKHSFKRFEKDMSHIENSLAWISRGHPTMKLAEVLDELENDLLAYGRQYFVRDRFKDKWLPFMSRPSSWSYGDARRGMYYYRVDIEPSLRVIEIIRRASGLPDRSPIET